MQNYHRFHFFPALLLLSILLGGITGYWFSDAALYLKPIGEIFLNLMLTALVPLIFFSISSAIAKTNSFKKLGHLFFYMLLVFLLMGVVVSLLTIMTVHIFPPASGINLSLADTPKKLTQSFASHLTGMFTAPDFSALFSHRNMLPLMVFSALTGLAVCTIQEKKASYLAFLQAGEELCMRLFNIILYMAPIGFFAYFAVLTSELGPKLLANYLHITIIYYVFTIVYFVLVYTFYAYLAGKKSGVQLFWRNIWFPAITAIATSSSAASIPANLEATKKMGVPTTICETVIPFGTLIHKQGSIIGGIIKIAFLFGLFHLDFSGFSILLTAVGVSLLVGTVMGAIPSGGMLGELLILSVYGFPASALMTIAAISILIDLPATMLNVTGNSVASMLIARLMREYK